MTANDVNEQSPYDLEDLRRGEAVTNAPMRTSRYAPLFFWRTGMLIVDWLVVSVSIGLGFWTTSRATDNRNALLSALQPPAVVWVSVQDIYVSAIMHSLGCSILWIVLVGAISKSIIKRKHHTTRFNGFAAVIIILSVWLLIAAAAETWFFARSGTQFVVTIDGVRVSQSAVNAILTAAGIPLRYRDTTHLRITVAFAWITFFTSVATTFVLLASTGAAEAKMRQVSHKAAAEDAGPGRTTALEKRLRASFDLPPRSPLRERNEKSSHGIEEVPRSSMDGEGDQLVNISLDPPPPSGVQLKPLDLGLNNSKTT